MTFCTNVKLKYRYDFTISGVGEHHSDQSKGFCSQIAVFEVC